ncbi:hypothetical protein LIER_44104 [Lithospermum erythrorhizon]|uniref:Uncharacterized protein n=1 Tax=Lithospermum erythrorhizon TaxID=34254 RepID=A0AAV3PP47_LITER
MAMTRFFTRKPVFQTHPSLSSVSQRHRSFKVNHPQLISIDLDSTAEGGAADIAAGIRNLEEALQSIIARRAAPDWLPFLPGYSYYVPPPTSNSQHGRFFEVLGQFSEGKNRRGSLLNREETMSFSRGVGWPSSAYFIEGKGFLICDLI